MGGVAADGGDQEMGTCSSPSNESCGHVISLAICKMGPCLALPSSQGSWGGRGEESLRCRHPKDNDVEETD